MILGKDVAPASVVLVRGPQRPTTYAQGATPMNQRTPIPFVRAHSAARRLLWLILPALLIALLPRVGPNTAWATVTADAPALFMTQFIDGLAIDGTTLFWKSACGGEFAPPRSRLSSSPTGAAARHDLYYPATCQADQVASASVA